VGVVLNNWSASSFSFLDWNVPSGSSLFQTVLIKQSGNSDVFNAADENTYPIRTELMPKTRISEVWGLDSQ
jgi:hypothetical protein